MKSKSVSRRYLLAQIGATAMLPRVAHATVGKGQRAAVITSASQPVIDVICGQSNMIYGVAKATPPDYGDTKFYQMYSGAEGPANVISLNGANDPLDNPDTAGQTPTAAIGNAVHFYRDWYSPAYNPSKVLFLPCAYGGTRVIGTGLNQWGVTTSVGGAAIGSLTTNAITRIKLARQLWPTAKLIMRLELVEGDFDAYTTFQAAHLCQWRAAYHCWILYMRAQLAAIGFANFPLLIGRPNYWALTVGGSVDANDSWLASNMVVADQILRALAVRMPYIGIADSMTPTQATIQASSQIHFDAAGQITMAGRYFTAYQQASANTNFATRPVWDSIDYLQEGQGFPSGFTVGSGGSTLSGTSTSAWKAALATTPSLPSSSTMLYAEVKVAAVASSSNIIIGLANQSVDLQIYLGGSSSNTMADFSSAGYFSGSTSLLANGSSGVWSQTNFSCPTLATGDVIMIALNRASGKAWVGRNGAWLNGGSPSSGSNPWISGIPQTDMIFLAGSIYTGAGNVLAIQGSVAQFSFSPPSGYQPWGH